MNEKAVIICSILAVVGGWVAGCCQRDVTPATGSVQLYFNPVIYDTRDSSWACYVYKPTAGKNAELFRIPYEGTDKRLSYDKDKGFSLLTVNDLLIGDYLFVYFNAKGRREKAFQVIPGKKNVFYYYNK